MNALLNHINNTVVFSNSDVATRMTDAQYEAIRKSLFAEKRVNVSPNRFNSKVPYQVSTRWTDNTTGETTWTNYGRFTDLDVASFVGTLAGMAVYGTKALRGNFDAAKAQANPELKAWLEDARNAEAIARAELAVAA